MYNDNNMEYDISYLHWTLHENTIALRPSLQTVIHYSVCF